MIPLCQTCWVERLDPIEVTLDLVEAVVDNLVKMYE